MCGGGGGGQMVVVVLLVCVVLVSSAAMAGGARTGPVHLAGGTASSSSAPGPAVATPRGDAAGATTMTATTTTMTAAATTATFAADPYKDSKRKVPNGPDPIHNRFCKRGCRSLKKTRFGVEWKVSCQVDDDDDDDHIMDDGE
ncbi:uncharacterized protein [Oryza sativa Japonica Group]|uniref:Uncharacterized protein n=5 Tax=Oryza TaxID=4527 RepID=A0A8J8YPN6_ORYSJ|nr:hypothetical protein [Oryza sativa Japonica Group]EAY91470.1 hypothetical protein OsI_13100 [Oryza sativa Indica Group]KAB8093098.1 hypothetical protein EE612_019804 [Oryza sativa]ABF98301.1 hypothetical protein LOC_Os03g48570 [Oryza sativa Japonica Group]EAZ28209.1 hypothetical protein OsJ_12181 [Oryza sativa Japonica Group]